MNADKEHIIIVTRRFAMYEGLGTENLSEVRFHPLTPESDLFSLFLNSFIRSDNSKIKDFMQKTLSAEDEDVKTYKKTFLEQPQSRDLQKKIQSLIGESNETIKSLRFLLKKQENSNNSTIENFSKQTNEYGDKNHYFHLLNIVEPVKNIFVFAHCPGELHINKKEFLTALRKDIIKILIDKEKQEKSDRVSSINNEAIKEKYCFNWLIHDADIFPHDKNYDGVVIYDNEQVTTENIDIPFELKNNKDNISCFIHSMDRSDFFKHFIIKYKETFKGTLTAKKFVTELLLDKEDCLRRMKLLNVSPEEIKDKENDIRNDAMLHFIFQKPKSIGLKLWQIGKCENPTNKEDSANGS